jgi:hypothetical protein
MVRRPAKAPAGAFLHSYAQAQRSRATPVARFLDERVTGKLIGIVQVQVRSGLEYERTAEHLVSLRIRAANQLRTERLKTSAALICSLRIDTRPEYSGSDAYIGATHAYRRLKVITHTHAELERLLKPKPVLYLVS